MTKSIMNFGTDKINIPALVIIGKHDNAIGPDHYQTFKFKNVEVINLDSGHHPYIENPLDFKNTIEDFKEQLKKSSLRYKI